MREDENQKKLLDSLKIASPCPANWNNMVGDKRERFCHDCKKNVYNLSSMSRLEAEDFLRNRLDSGVCVQFFQRQDGTILSEDCPVGIAAIRKQCLRIKQYVASILALLLGSIFSPSFAQENTVKKTETDKDQVRQLRGEASIPLEPTRGRVDTTMIMGSPVPNFVDCNSQGETRLLNKVNELKKDPKSNKPALIRATLDLAAFYRSQKKYSQSISRYDEAISLLKLEKKQKSLLKNAQLNLAAVKNELKNSSNK